MIGCSIPWLFAPDSRCLRNHNFVGFQRSIPRLGSKGHCDQHTTCRYAMPSATPARAHHMSCRRSMTTRVVILTIHWHGGQHSQVRVRKLNPASMGSIRPKKPGDYAMATRWSDADIAATLNRMGMQTGQGKTWTPAALSRCSRCARSAANDPPTRMASGSLCRARPPGLSLAC